MRPALTALLTFAFLSLPVAGTARVTRDAPYVAGSVAGDELLPPTLGAILDPYDPPASPWGVGHRGIDIQAEPADPLLASIGGTVSFAGLVAGSLYVTLEAPDASRRVTYSYLSEALVAKGDQVVPGQIVGLSGQGHPTDKGFGEHFHFGLRIPDPASPGDWIYQDPTSPIRTYLRRYRHPVVHLAA